MKIVFFISSLSSGGAERVLSVLVNHFVKNHNIVVVTGSKEVEDFYDLNPRVKRICLLGGNKEENSKISTVQIVSSSILAMVNIINTEKPDLVVSFISKMNVMAILASKIARTPVVISEHSNPYSDISGFFRVARITLYRYANFLVCPTVGVDKYFDRLVNVKQRAIINNPLPVGFSQSFNAEKKNKIIFMGRFSAVKRIELLVEAVSLISNELKEANWLVEIYGGGNKEEENKLLQVIDFFELNNLVSFRGKTRNPREVMSESKILALTSKHESFGNAITEAMACGCVPVSTDCDFGPREIITHEKDGLLTGHSAREIAKALLQLVNNPVQLEGMQKEAVKIQRRLNVERIGFQWESVFQKVAKRQ
ncbi:glycosyltransferase [Marinobacter sp.]|uniref:glycosyltransferase n=1 Tax=Marinobacter sp. TaxID=50741 RepID=UPI00384C5744